MAAPTLYYMPESGPCRTVMLTARVLGIKLNTKLLDLMKGEHHTEEFLKINPVHNVPALTDGDFSLNESRAIMTYLVEKYAKDDSLYPRNVKQRAIINQRLQFDIGTLYKPIIDCYVRIYYGNKTYDESKIPAIKTAFEFLNTFLANAEYVAGDQLTVADLAVVSSVGTAICVLDFDISPYPNVVCWYQRMRTTLPDFKEIMQDNEHKLRVLVDSFRK